jgi:cell division protein FtsQ
MFSVIRKITELFTRKKKSRPGFHVGQFPLHGIPGNSSVYRQRSRSPLSKVKLLLQERGRKKNEGYGRPVKKSRLLPRCTLVFFLILLAGLFVLMDGKTRIEKNVTSISFFQVNQLIISGCKVISREKLREQSKIILHQTSLLGMETEVIEDLLEENPWVSLAKVKRNWPSTVEIEIKEFVPVALLHSTTSEPDQLYYIDRDGTAFTSVTIGENIDFPVITGLTEIKDRDARKKAFAEVLLFLRKVGRNDPHLPVQSVSEVHVSDDGELVVYLVEYPFPIFFGNGNTWQKYRRLIRVLQALYKKQKGEEIISSVEYIRMDYLNDKVLVAQSGS